MSDDRWESKMIQELALAAAGDKVARAEAFGMLSGSRHEDSERILAAYIEFRETIIRALFEIAYQHYGLTLSREEALVIMSRAADDVEAAFRRSKSLDTILGLARELFSQSFDFTFH